MVKAAHQVHGMSYMYWDFRTSSDPAAAEVAKIGDTSKIKGIDQVYRTHESYLTAFDLHEAEKLACTSCKDGQLHYLIWKVIC